MHSVSTTASKMSVPGEANQAALEFAAAIFASFRRAAASSPELVRDYRIGNFLIRLRFAGEAMIPQLTPALEHLAVPPSESRADLTVCVWDSISTRESLPPPPWPNAAYGKRAEITGFNTERIRTVYHLESSVLSLLDLKENLGFYWTRDAANFPIYKIAAPLISILHWWLRERGHQVVHTAAVGNANGAVLIAGRSGSGKSTSALACLDSRLLYLGDDYCLIAAAPEPHVHSLFSSAKLTPASLARLPHLRGAIHREADELTDKSLLFLHREFRKKIGHSLPLRAVLIPRVTGGHDTSLARISPVAALTALAPSTIYQLAGAGQSALQIMTAVVKQLPCYELRLGTEIRQIPEVIASLLDKHHA